MGSLTLPPSGVVYLDAQAIIYTVEEHPQYAPLLDDLWQASATGRVTAATSQLTWLEVLIRPWREGNHELLSR